MRVKNILRYNQNEKKKMQDPYEETIVNATVGQKWRLELMGKPTVD